jgi:hypothetical protein
MIAYVAIGLAQYGSLAPLYFIRLFLNYRRLSKMASVDEIGD